MGNKLYTTLFALGAFILLVTHYLDNYSHPETLIPYPYKVSYGLPLDYQQISDSNVLIVGDRMGKYFAKFKDLFLSEGSKNLTTTLKLYDWSEDNEPIYRTIAKLKALKKLPPIVIYHGASTELYETHFNVSDNKIIKDNFEIYKDPVLVSAMMALPFLSRLLYSRPQIITIDGNSPAKESDEIFASAKMQINMELKYKLYETEVEQLIKLVQKRKSHPILVTTPINYLEPAKSTCANATTPSVESKLDEIEQLFSNGDYKTAFVEADELSKVAVGNSKVLFWLGKLFKYTGNNRAALKTLKTSAALDCSSWRGSPIFNAIISKKTKSLGAKLLDFDSIVYQQYWNEDLFLDSIYPNNQYYEQASEIMSKYINELVQTKM